MPRYLTRSFCLLSLSVLQVAQAQSPDARQRVEQLATTSSLQQPDMKPWHLAMTFDLHDLGGKVSESGTIEEWWVAPAKYRIVITSPSFNQTIPDAKASEDSRASRTAFLIRSLLDQITNPIPHFSEKEALSVAEGSRDFGKVKLTCLTVSRSIPQAKGKPTETAGPVFCVDPGTDILRSVLDTDQAKVIVRNRLGKFRSNYVALDDAFFYNGKIAIEGKVTKLEGYDPQANPVDLLNVSPTPAPIPGIVLAGKSTRKVPPIYPQIAKAKGVGGTVLLTCIISKAGAISSVEVVSSPDPSLSEASINAIKQWQYQPYLLNGQLTEVDTTITVHFNLNGF